MPLHAARPLWRVLVPTLVMALSACAAQVVPPTSTSGRGELVEQWRTRAEVPAVVAAVDAPGRRVEVHASGSPLRRIRELDFIRNITHLGIRDIRSRAADYADATRLGSAIVTREQIRAEGPAAIVESMPAMGNTYVTIDIDGLDPSIAPGTGSPAVDGLLYHEVRKLLQGVAAKGNVVGFDLVEVNPLVDLHGQTSLLATTLIAEFLGAIFSSREQGGQALAAAS